MLQRPVLVKIKFIIQLINSRSQLRDMDDKELAFSCKNSVKDKIF
jgi:hypothetical protein